MEIPVLREALMEESLQFALVRFTEEGWSSTGVVKRQGIDRRTAAP
jgi:hypothetical protein